MAKPARNRPTSIRFSPEEFAVLEALAAETGTGLSTLVRGSVRLALAVPTEEEANLRGFERIGRELARVGNNLNQLTRRANSGNFVMTGADRAHMAAVKETLGQVSALFEDYQRLAARRDLTAQVAEIGS